MVLCYDAMTVRNKTTKISCLICLSLSYCGLYIWLTDWLTAVTVTVSSIPSNHSDPVPVVTSTLFLPGVLHFLNPSGLSGVYVCLPPQPPYCYQHHSKVNSDCCNCSTRHTNLIVSISIKTCLVFYFPSITPCFVPPFCQMIKVISLLVCRGPGLSVVSAHCGTLLVDSCYLLSPNYW